MTQHDVVIAIFADHRAANTAVGELIHNGFDIKNFSVIGKGYHTEENVVGFYNVGERMRFWGKYGAFWGGMWGLFFGGIFLTIPMVGPVVVLGHLAVIVVSAIEGALVVGGLTAIGAALFSIGIPKDSVIKYEEAIKADNFLIVAHGTKDEMARAKAVLAASHPKQLDLHQDVLPPVASNQTAPMTT
jgi:hypothetical protein